MHMEPPDRAPRPRPADAAADDERDSLPWLRDEAASTPRPSPRPSPPPTDSARGPWWSRFVGGDSGLAKSVRVRPVPAEGPVQPFDGPHDTATVVASRDELLRAVREYMSGRTQAPPSQGRTSETPPDEPDPPPASLSPVDTRPEATLNEDAAAPAHTKGGDIFDILASRRAQAPPPLPPPLRGDLAADLEAESDPLHPLPPSPAFDPSEESETRKITKPGRDETRRLQKGDNDDTRGPSAMARERVLPSAGAGPPRKRPKTQVPSDRSLSSFAIDEDARPLPTYPNDFMTQGLRMLVTRQWSLALDYYRTEAKRNPRDILHLYGQGAALLGLHRIDESAAMLARAYEAQPDFPLSQLILDARPDDPIAWYNLAAALVSERTRAAYHCAEIILTECLDDAGDDQLRGRAQRAQQNIARMLEQRSKLDEERHQDGPGGPLAAIRPHAPWLGLIAVIAGAWLLWRSATSTPRPPVPVSSPSAAAARTTPSTAPSAAPARRR